MEMLGRLEVGENAGMLYLLLGGGGGGGEKSVTPFWRKGGEGKFIS